MKPQILALLPDRTFILVIVFVAIALIIGLVTRRVAFSIIGTLILFALLGPFFDSLFDALPLWILLIMIVVFFLSIGRFIRGGLFGKGATDEFVGHFMWAVFSLPFRLIGRVLSRRRRW